MSNWLYSNNLGEFFHGHAKSKKYRNTDKFRRVCQISGRTYCKFIGLPKQCLLELSTPIKTGQWACYCWQIIEHQLGLVERWVLTDNLFMTIPVDIFVCYMATVVCALWLADSCNDRDLLARCPRHVQSMLLIVEILMDDHVMVKRQLSKRASTDLCHLPIL